MKTKRLLLATIMLIAALTLYANPRSKQAIASAAAQVLNSTSTIGMKHAPRHDKLVELKANESVTVMGYQSGGYAIIGNDDRIPLVIGYSNSKFMDSCNNPSFNDYLLKISDNARRIVSDDNTSMANDTMLYKDKIEPFIKSKWGQYRPFNDMCPIMDNKGTHAATGCIATALAQILNYNQYPSSGKGIKTVSFNGEKGKDSITIDFTQSHYDYGNMLDSYKNGYSDIQSNAVAKLMLDCGVAVGMSYHIGESTSTLRGAQWALRSVFNLSENIERIYFTKMNKEEKEKWMNTIYKELNAHRPVMYNGAGFKYGKNHAYILDGYDENGNIHINWGWNGSNDGYYNINMAVAVNDEALIGIEGSKEKDYEVTVVIPGTLSELLPRKELKVISTLKVNGNINSSDLKALRYITGSDSVGNFTDGKVPLLDLRNANIISGGEPYFITANKEYSTTDNCMPDYAFYRCRSLRGIYLPLSLDSVGYKAFDGITSLDSISFSKAFPVVDGGVYNSDTTELLRVYTSKTGTFNVVPSTRIIREDAFHGCDSIEEIQLYKKLRVIGDRAFAGMKGIKTIWARSIEISVGCNVYDNINSECIFYIPPVDHEMYKYNRCSEWGICIYNLWYYERKYGEENPTIEAEYFINNVPDSIVDKVKVFFNATPKSPVGSYKLCANNNDSCFDLYPFVFYDAGGLYVSKNKALLKADTCYINGTNVGSQTLTYSIKGLQNDEKDIPDEDWIKKPVLQLGSRASDNCYKIIWKEQGESRNYEFEYAPGIAFVGTATNIKAIESNDNGKENIYNLNGQKVKDNFHGIAIVNGRKVVRK